MHWNGQVYALALIFFYLLQQTTSMTAVKLFILNFVELQTEDCLSCNFTDKISCVEHKKRFTGTEE